MKISNKNQMNITFEKSENKYVLDLDKIPENCMLNCCSRFEKSNTYHENFVKYEDFKIIHDLINKIPVDQNTIIENLELLDYYGLNYKDHLINEMISHNFLKNLNFPIYNNHEDFMKNLQIVKSELLPVVPFTLIFLEGHLSLDCYGDIEFVDLDMEPIYISFGENNCIYKIHNVGYLHYRNKDSDTILTEELALKYFGKNEKYHNKTKEYWKDLEYTKYEDDRADFFYNKVTKKFKMNLLIEQKPIIKDILFDEFYIFDFSFKYHIDYEEIEKSTDYYDLLKTQELVINKKHFNLIISTFEKLNIVEKIKNELENQKFKFTQSENMFNTYDGPKRFGKCNVLILYGLMPIV